MFDWYGRRARLAPIALAAVPAVVLGGGSLTDLANSGSIVAFVLASVGLVACGLVRNLGLRIEPELWRQWGGPPTTQLLRWSSDDPEVEQRHDRLSRITGRTLPTRAEEAEDPAGADRQYHTAIGDLRDLTRDRQRFALVAEENAEYGFRRNCLGLRPAAIGIACSVAIGSTILILLGSALEHYTPSVLTGLVAAGGWWQLVRPEWVRQAGEKYAVRLLETLATLSRDQV